MSGGDAVRVEIGRLGSLEQMLVDLAGDVNALVNILANVRADTGRADSDQAGRVAPHEAGQLCAGLNTSLIADSGSIATCVADYQEADRQAARGYRDLLLSHAGELAGAA